MFPLNCCTSLKQISEILAKYNVNQCVGINYLSANILKQMWQNYIIALWYIMAFHCCFPFKILCFYLKCAVMFLTSSSTMEQMFHISFSEYTHRHAGEVIPASLTLFNQTAECQQRQGRRRLLASKHRCKQSRKKELITVYDLTVTESLLYTTWVVAVTHDPYYLVYVYSIITVIYSFTVFWQHCLSLSSLHLHTDDLHRNLL